MGLVFNFTNCFYNFWFFFKEVYIIAIMMKSQKFIACFKSQKSLKEGLLKEEFFEEVMNKIEE